jgi:hypothetical protein
MDTAADSEIDEFFVAFTPGSAAIVLRYQIAVLIVGIGIDTGEGADPTRRRPGAGTLAVGYGDALATFHERQHFSARNDQRLQWLHTVPGVPSLPMRTLSWPI